MDSKDCPTTNSPGADKRGELDCIHRRRYRPPIVRRLGKLVQVTLKSGPNSDSAAPHGGKQ